MTFPELLEAYVADLLEQGRSRSTVRLNRRWLEGYFEFCAGQGVQTVAGLAPEHLTGFHRELSGPDAQRRGGRRYSPHSLYQMLQMLRAFLRWAFARGYFERDLGADVSLPRTYPTGNLSALDLEHLYASAEDARDVALLAIFAEGELSQNQVHRLNLEDVDLTGRRLLVKGKPQVLRPRLAEALTAYLERERGRSLEGERAVFTTGSGLRLSTDAIGARLRALGKLAGLSQSLSARLLVRSGRVHR